MQHSVIGGPEAVIIFVLFIFGLWWLLSFFPGKASLAASTILISFMPGPALPSAPPAASAGEHREDVLL